MKVITIRQQLVLSVLAAIGLAAFIVDAALPDTSCLTHANAADCKSAVDDNTAESCVWCTAGAVPSECLPTSLAKKLPASVFHCEFPSALKEGSLRGETGPDRRAPYPHVGVNDVMKEMASEDIRLSSELKAIMLKAPATFDAWKDEYKRRYVSLEEEAKAFQAFRETLLEVSRHNLQLKSDRETGTPGRTYGLELNEFADMSWADFKSTYLMTVTSSQNCSATHVKGQFVKPEGKQVPQAMDWREVGAVSEVKNQGHCGSCWTFSTTGAVESHHYLATGQMTLLSEQQLVDCAQLFDNHGCSGGLPSHAFEYVRYNGGLDTEDAYPYKASEIGECDFLTDGVGALVQRSVNITYKDEGELYEAVGTVGPVSVAFQVQSDFKSFAFGVYDNPECGTEPDEVNHAVLAVGYGVEEGGDGNGVDYWLVKNSWGASWGLDGYFKMVRGKNMCGIADCAAYPLIDPKLALHLVKTATE